MTSLLNVVLESFWKWIGATILFVLLLSFLDTLFRWLFLGWSRFLRHLNIRKHGWPPEHLDADGDSKNL